MRSKKQLLKAVNSKKIDLNDLDNELKTEKSGRRVSKRPSEPFIKR